MKFDDLVLEYLNEAGDPKVPTETPNKESPPPAEGETPQEEPTPQDSPENTPPAPEEPPQNNVDIDSVTVEFTKMVMKALKFGLENSGNYKGEIDKIMTMPVTSPDEAVTVLDSVDQLLHNEIDRATPNFKAPGVV